MAQPSEKPLPPTPPTTDNPVVALGRKVKSALSLDQQPSIRIRRESSSPGVQQYDLPSQGLPEKTTADSGDEATTKGNTSGNGFTSRIRSLFSRPKASPDDKLNESDYDNDMVDLLDVLDPEVSTLSTLTNVQNSLFVPSLGKMVNRRPTYKVSEGARTADKLKSLLRKLSNPLTRKPSTIQKKFEYAVLPDDEKLEGWTKEEMEEMDDMVRHMLHSKRAKFKRSMKGFKQYVRRPFGLFITVYATLITLFGAAWVFFLIGWISLGSKQDYVVNIVDNVLVALFAIIGDGLAPFRAVDTYHMIYIAHYHRISWKRREKLGLPELVDHNDLPDQRIEDAENAEVDIESLVARRMPRGLARKLAPRIPKNFARRMIIRSKINDPAFEYSVLTEEEQAKLDHHERKFSKSHTFYKPHETETHYAFPLKLLVTVVLLLDLHSALQISLGACTWGINYHTRPFALTTVILCCSITANITAGVLISKGDKRTRKQDVIERMMRQELTADAIEEIETRKLKEAEERGVVDPVLKRKYEEKEAAENEEIKKSWKSVPLLPKKLLGKGEDKRQPALPQAARRSGSNVGVESPASSSSKTKVAGSGRNLAAVKEDPIEPLRRKPVPGGVTVEDPLNPGKGRRIMQAMRKADLDRS